jgi:membrane-bound metal-dependent hydrolase YbcI (DUF457 family)
MLYDTLNVLWKLSDRISVLAASDFEQCGLMLFTDIACYMTIACYMIVNTLNVLWRLSVRISVLAASDFEQCGLMLFTVVACHIYACYITTNKTRHKMKCNRACYKNDTKIITLTY